MELNATVTIPADQLEGVDPRLVEDEMLSKGMRVISKLKKEGVQQEKPLPPGQFRVDGYVYTTAPEVEGCDGCAACEFPRLCKLMPDCRDFLKSGDPCIFVEVKK